MDKPADIELSNELHPDDLGARIDDETLTIHKDLIVEIMLGLTDALESPDIHADVETAINQLNDILSEKVS